MGNFLEGEQPMTSISLALSKPIIIDLPRAVFANVPSSVVVIDIGNYHPGFVMAASM